MKTQKEIEQLAKEEYPSIIGTTQTGIGYDMNAREKEAYIKGYTQCQEDMADKKYTEEDLKKAYDFGSNALLGVSKDSLIESLNKQD